MIELNPNVAFAHALLGMALAQEGQLIEATQSIQRASRLNPLPDNTLLMIRASVNFAAGRRQQAIELLEQVRVANPDNIISRIALAASYEQDGRHEDASAAVQEVLSVTPDLTVERAMSLIPSLETTVSAQEFAEYPHYLRKAGLR